VKKEKETMRSYITVRQNTTGEANIICAQIKLICVAADTGRYYPANLLDYKAVEMLLKEFLYKYQAVTLISEN
jgi:hypothetical protein